VVLASNKSAGSSGVSETAFWDDVTIQNIPPPKPEPDTGLQEWPESSGFAIVRSKINSVIDHLCF